MTRRPGPLNWRLGFQLALTAILAEVALTSACTRVLVPLGTPGAQPLATELARATLTAESHLLNAPIVFSLFGVPPGGALLVRQPAGISGTVVAELPADLRDLQLTGQTTPLGSSTWVEIKVASGGTGWITLWNLTEDIEPEAFCLDPRVPALLDTFFAAVRDRSGEALAQTISPRRGLVLRHDWWNDQIVVPLAEVGGLMQRVEPIAWGVQRGSGAPIVGPFRDRLLPGLDLLLDADPQQACDHLLYGDSGMKPEWPGEYARLNFVSFYQPAPDPGPRLNWRTWAVGVEYVDGVPYVAVLIRYQGDL
jgi:hypothetical protein